MLASHVLSVSSICMCDCFSSLLALFNIAMAIVQEIERGSSWYVSLQTFQSCQTRATSRETTTLVFDL